MSVIMEDPVTVIRCIDLWHRRRYRRGLWAVRRRDYDMVFQEKWRPLESIFEITTTYDVICMIDDWWCDPWHPVTGAA